MMMSNLAVTDLIPQRPPFVFIDKLIATDEQMTRTSYIVPVCGLLQQNGFLSAGGLLENMAQTAAVRLGNSTYPNVRVGVIGSVKNLTINNLPAIGTQLLTQVTEILQYQDMSVLEAKVFAQDELIANCQLNVVLL